MIWYVAIGSAAGGVSRYLLGGMVQRASGAAFPVGTLVVNVTGSLLLGFILRYAVDSSASPEMRALLAVGFCGGYTTFSAFSQETVTLIAEGRSGRAILYVALSLLLSIAATWIGMLIARSTLGAKNLP